MVDRLESMMAFQLYRQQCGRANAEGESHLRINTGVCTHDPFIWSRFEPGRSGHVRAGSVSTQAVGEAMSASLRAALQRQWLAYKAHDHETFSQCVALVYALAMAEGVSLNRLHSFTGETYPASQV